MPDRFTRTIVRQGDRILIESTCRQCGFKILGSAMDDSLPASEKEHAAECERIRQSASAAG